SRLGWYDLAVTTATELEIFFDYALLYPTPYAELVEAAAREFDLEPAMLYAIMRQESLFRTDVQSSAGARGLMQLQPGTAEAVLRRLGEPVPRTLDLLDPATNIRLGAAEFARLLERYDDHAVPALAAYNAGPTPVDRWLPDQPVEGDIWLENVPYNETRDYVRRVLWHSVVYEWLERGRGVDVDHWLDDVRPLP
ncbi:MAG: lytic transglycosylase domain-containing protein, partial [Gammaproteobacteria bacterium]|nr:lytic transglycosylase domain-containing protein [Gammaproteobacteria bacterium]